jgi:hypothetical protein
VAIAHLDRRWGQPVDLATPTVAVAQDGLRYVTRHEPRAERVLEELFDSRSDPRELDDLLAERPEDAARLRALAEEYLASKPVWDSAPPTLELDEIQLNQLRALGYAVP